ncbi:MAG: hypothetical protein ACPL7J_15630 [Desulfomonilaceae bacterium]
MIRGLPRGLIMLFRRELWHVQVKLSRFIRGDAALTSVIPWDSEDIAGTSVYPTDCFLNQTFLLGVPMRERR